MDDKLKKRTKNFQEHEVVKKKDDSTQSKRDVKILKNNKAN